MSLKTLLCFLMSAISITVLLPTLTLASPPSVETRPATGVLPTVATLNGSLNSLGSASSVQVSFEWGETTNYGNATTPQTLHIPADFSSPLSGLYAQHTYHFRAKVVGDGIAYGEDVTLTTSSLLPPIVDTKDASNISSNSARFNGDLTWLGSTGVAVINYTVNVSFQWGTSPGSYPNETAAQAMTTKGAFYFDQGSLTPGITYYFRAKAVGSSVTYGVEKNFGTASPPSVETRPASGVLPTVAQLNGALNSLGSASSVQVSFEWGETTNYGNATTPQTLHIPADFSSPLSGLYAQHTYHFRAKVGGDGIAYGEDVTLTTPSLLPPIVDTKDASNISSNSARFNGDLTWLGSTGVAVINYTVNVSFEWGTSPGAYPNETTTQAMTSTGAFYFYQDSLSPGTTYYLRAKAVGSSVTYGVEKDFTTASGGGGGICSGGASAAPGEPSEMTTTLAALGLLLGLGYWLVGRRTKHGRASFRAQQANTRLN